MDFQSTALPSELHWHLAESGGVEPHPISENPVFKAGRRTNAPASLSYYLASRVSLELTTPGFGDQCSAN